jgi:hypothetical protein
MRRRSSAGTMAQVSSGAMKTDRGRSKSPRSPHRESQNFLSSLLHPGPTLPSSHRNVEGRHGISTIQSRPERSMSMSTAQGRAGRSVSPGSHGIPLDGIAEGSGRVEGRRSFFQEGVNPAPAATTGNDS